MVYTVVNLNSRFITKQDVRIIKARRRTLKNRGYAHSCRIKKGTETRNQKAQLETYVVETSFLAQRLKKLEAQITAITSSSCSQCKELIQRTNVNGAGKK